jgi:hypothetical protein
VTTPALGDIQPIDYTCVREVGAAFGDRLCGQPATWHAMWDAETRENARACDEHMAEAHDRWPPYDWHPLNAACMAPGSMWQPCEPAGTGFCIEGETHPDLAALTMTMESA